MNARIKKEIWLLAPTALAALGLTIGGLIWDRYSGQGIAALSFVVACALLGVACMGRELACGTALGLFSQPIPRWRLWSEKITMLSAGYVVLIMVFGVASFHDQPISLLEYVYSDQLAITVLAPLIGLSGGLFLTVLTRQAGAAFWFLLLLSVASGLALMAVLEARDWQEYRAASLWMGYGGLAALLYTGARYAFVNFQNRRSWSASLIFARRQVFRANKACWGTTRALIYKEWRLQLMHLLFTALLLFAFLILIMIYQANEPQRIDILYLTFFRNLFYLLPVLVGAAAIAEERRQELSAWHLTLPPTRIRQWRMKLLVCMVLGVSLGGLVPLVLDGTIWALHQQGIIREEGYLWFLGGIWVILVYYLLIPLLGVILGLYASSLSTSYQQAITKVIFVGIILFGINFLATLLIGKVGPISSQALFGFIYTPLCAVTLLLLAFRNRHAMSVDRRLLRKNGGLFATSAVACQRQ